MLFFEWPEVTSGIPKGSVLGSLLFVIYITTYLLISHEHLWLYLITSFIHDSADKHIPSKNSKYLYDSLDHSRDKKKDSQKE